MITVEISHIASSDHTADVIALLNPQCVWTQCDLRHRCLSVWVAQMTVFSSAILWAVVFLLFSLLCLSPPLHRERVMW